MSKSKKSKESCHCNCSPCCCPQAASPSNSQRGLLIEFDVDQPSTAIATTFIELDTDSLNLATVNLFIDSVLNRVWLTGTVHWFSRADDVDVRFFITRTRIDGVEMQLFSTLDEADGSGNQINTSFSFVDEQPTITGGEQLVIYRLYADLSQGPAGTAVVNGPIIFTGAEIAG